MKIDMQLLKYLSELSTPHMKKINDAVTEAFPDTPDQAYTLAIGFQLCVLLDSLNEDDRPRAVEGINLLLAQQGKYRLVPKLDA
jgi:hypothetical protein